MKGRQLLVAAGMVVIISNAWVPVAVRLNQQQAEGGTLELTESELALVPQPGESTVRLLEFRWRTEEDAAARGPRWLDQAMLETLGFDCHVPLSDAKARDHYRTLGNRPAWLVLTVSEQAGPPRGDGPLPPTRLMAVDAGPDAEGLRRRYPDPGKHAIVRGVVHLSVVDLRPDSRDTGAVPRLQGWIVTLLPAQIFVPRPDGAVLDALPRRPSDSFMSEPRYTATVSWGTLYTPWLKQLRTIGSASTADRIP